MADPSQLLQRAVDHHRSGRLAEAEALYREAIESDPDNPDALHLLGVLRTQGGDPTAGQDLIRRAIAQRPGAAIFHNNLGKALAETENWAESIAAHRQALALDPRYAEAQYNLGVAFQEQGDYVTAEATYRRALELAPNSYKAAHNLGVVLMGLGQPQAAVGALRRALEIKPDEADTHRTILQAILYDPSLDNPARFAEHCRFAARFGQPRSRRQPVFGNVCDAGRPLRIGWLSSDFRDHPVARNLEPFFTHRDRAAAAFICYADVPKPDAISSRFEKLSDTWRPVAGRSDAEVADLIRSDAVDILVVLAGRFDRNRPLVSVYRPAPIQVGLFDAATSGLETIDYFIADRFMAPPRRSEQFTERVLRLPSLYVHEPLRGAPSIGPPPSSQAGFVTFGSFNNPAENNGESRRALCGPKILEPAPNSRLLLKYKNRFEPLGARMHEVLASAPELRGRIEISDVSADHSSHLATHGRIDIALDPFPFNGSTTTFEALWMGVPVLTLAGENFMSRWTASMLHALKLDELIANTPQEYVAKAASLAANPARLAELRTTLRARLAASSLCDGQLRARQIQRLFRALWRRWCKEVPGHG